MINHCTQPHLVATSRHALHDKRQDILPDSLATELSGPLHFRHAVNAQSGLCTHGARVTYGSSRYTNTTRSLGRAAFVRETPVFAHIQSETKTHLYVTRNLRRRNTDSLQQEGSVNINAYTMIGMEG
jgi:hypothetical protein